MHTITKKQQENLLEAARLIEANPRHFSMSGWICGSTACVAGWAMMVDQKRTDLSGAEKWFDNLTYENKTASIIRACGFYDGKLFLATEWIDCLPKSKYRRAIDGDWNEQEKAKAAADYVRWFVANHTTVEKSK
jgi:hypothetical protein